MISARLDRIKVGTSIIPAPIGLITDRNGTGKNKVPWNGAPEFPPFNALSAVISAGMMLLMLLDVDGDVDGHPMISSSTLSRSARNNRGARRGVPV